MSINSQLENIMLQMMKNDTNIIRESENNIKLFINQENSELVLLQLLLESSYPFVY